MVKAINLGFPRIGARRELKKATESYWKAELNAVGLENVARELRATNWKKQKDAGLDIIPSNDFAFYDQVLDMTAVVGNVPPRFNWTVGRVDLDTYFAMARGLKDATACEMTKWFDTNYHYIVPEFDSKTAFSLASTKPVDHYREALALGIETRPVLIGPLTYLKLGKAKGDLDVLTLLPGLLAVYEQLLGQLAAAGCKAVQIDEPILVLDLDKKWQDAFAPSYERLAKAGVALNLATYFEGLRDNLSVAVNLPVASIHVDLVRAPEQLDAILAAIKPEQTLSLGVINGRNIWRADLTKALALVEKAVAKLGKDRVLVGPSCSMLHVPVDLDHETKLDAELKGWLAFAKQKLAEIRAVATAANQGRGAVEALFAASDKAQALRASSPRLHNPAVKDRLAKVTAKDSQRTNPYVKRREKQQAALKLPLFPTTTIGSFPQTKEVREQRAAFKRGDITEAAYNDFLKVETEKTIRIQEEIGIDVLVHGEFERNDMVEYFGENLAGFTFTQNGWVQSYGSRYVKPPVIYGDVSRPHPMTVEWSGYAKSLTDRPMKGMLTGPVTILMWSFVRDDQPRSETCRQIALAIRDEVVDLEAANIQVIQIDEPAFREGLPLRKGDWDAYLKWAAESFRLSASGVRDETQIHTHMCYCEFNDIIDHIAALDADVISIETSRSDMELLEAFVDFKYPNEIGPGVWDIHSPRVPAKSEMLNLMEKAARVIDPAQLWVNPDCGLKTRGWPEVKDSLVNLVEVARELRKSKAAAA